MTITREGNEDAVVFETLQCSRKLKKDMKLLYFSEKRKKEGTIIWSSENRFMANAYGAKRRRRPW